MPIRLHKSRDKNATPADLIEQEIRLGLKIVKIYEEAKFYKKQKVERAIASIIRNANGILGCGGNFKNGCLYREANLNEIWRSTNNEEVVCDHAVPVTKLVELYVDSKIDIRELIFSPVVRISKETDEKLTEKHKTSGTETNLPLFRYSHIGINIITHKNQMVDPTTWTYEDHWNLINETEELTETLEKLFGQDIPYKQSSRPS